MKPTLRLKPGCIQGGPAPGQITFVGGRLISFYEWQGEMGYVIDLPAIYTHLDGSTFDTHLEYFVSSTGRLEIADPDASAARIRAEALADLERRQ